MRDHDALIAFVEGRMRTPFAWGRSANDCISFGLGAITAQTGRDLLKGSGLRWSSAAGAARVLKQLGGIEAAIDRYLPEVSPAMARRGDVGIVAGERGPLLMVIEGDTLVGPSEHGEQRMPRGLLIKAWDIEGAA